MAVAFDILKATTRLQNEAGFSEKQARALVNTFAVGIVENIATKQDLAELATKADLAALCEDRSSHLVRSELVEKPPRPGFRGRLLLTASPWNI